MTEIRAGKMGSRRWLSHSTVHRRRAREEIPELIKNTLKLPTGSVKYSRQIKTNRQADENWNTIKVCTKLPPRYTHNTHKNTISSRGEWQMCQEFRELEWSGREKCVVRKYTHIRHCQIVSCSSDQSLYFNLTQEPPFLQLHSHLHLQNLR